MFFFNIESQEGHFYFASKSHLLRDILFCLIVAVIDSVSSFIRKIIAFRLKAHSFEFSDY